MSLKDILDNKNLENIDFITLAIVAERSKNFLRGGYIEGSIDLASNLVPEDLELTKEDHFLLSEKLFELFYNNTTKAGNDAILYALSKVEISYSLIAFLKIIQIGNFDPIHRYQILSYLDTCDLGSLKLSYYFADKSSKDKSKLKISELIYIIKSWENAPNSSEISSFEEIKLRIVNALVKLNI